MVRVMGSTRDLGGSSTSRWPTYRVAKVEIAMGDGLGAVFTCGELMPRMGGRARIRGDVGKKGAQRAAPLAERRLGGLRKGEFKR